MKKYLFILFFSIFSFSDAYTQVNTERTKAFFKALRNIGDAPATCETKVESLNTSVVPVDFTKVKLKLKSKKLETYDGVKVSVLFNIDKQFKKAKFP